MIGWGRKATPEYVQMATRQNPFNFSNPPFENLSKAQFLGGNVFMKVEKSPKTHQFDLTAVVACGSLLED